MEITSKRFGSFFCITFLFLYVTLILIPRQSISAAPASIRQNISAGATTIIYDSIPNPLPPNIASLGFEATQTSEFGDYIHLSGKNREVSTITVTMSDWALHSDYPMMPSEGWNHPITLKIYNVVTGTPNAVGLLLGTKTQTFVIPWRPEADPACSNGKWKASNGTCYSGITFNITFDLSSLSLTLPDNIIVGISYNTGSSGSIPIGRVGPYNSLNVGAAGSATIGTDANTDRVFWNTSTASLYADNGTVGVGIFREDIGWSPSGTLPIQITAYKFDQTITFDPLIDKPLGSPDFTVSATSDSGLTVSFASTSSVCTVSGTTVHLLTTGTCTIRASQEGNTNYNTATDVDQSFTITSKKSGGDTTGVFRPNNGLLYLKNINSSGIADIAINYGAPGDYPVAGDWDGNCTATIGIYRNGSFYLRNSNTAGFADIVFAFGQPGDQPIAGDWDGDGTDTIGIFRPSNGLFLLRNSNSAGAADYSFYLGNVGDVGIAGDWDGDGEDTIGVFRPSNGVIFMKNTNTTGFADIAINYGIPGDLPVTGDWNGDGIDTIGVYRNGQFLLRDRNTLGFADMAFYLGNPGDMPIAGNWDGMP